MPWHWSLLGICWTKAKTVHILARLQQLYRTNQSDHKSLSPHWMYLYTRFQVTWLFFHCIQSVLWPSIDHFDIHCRTPSKLVIFFSKLPQSKGLFDSDSIYPKDCLLFRKNLISSFCNLLQDNGWNTLLQQCNDTEDWFPYNCCTNVKLFNCFVYLNWFSTLQLSVHFLLVVYAAITSFVVP